MPYVNVQITKGATRAQKAQLVREMTDSLVRILGKKPEHTHIVIQEIAEADWGIITVSGTISWRVAGRVFFAVPHPLLKQSRAPATNPATVLLVSSPLIDLPYPPRT